MGDVLSMNASVLVKLDDRAVTKRLLIVNRRLGKSIL